MFTISTYNPNFTRVEIWFRFFFVAATSMVSLCYFYLSALRRFHLGDWSYEQKWTGFLLILLLGFDNPAFSHTILTSNPLPGILDAIGQGTFLFSLLLFWICLFHGLRQTERYMQDTPPPLLCKHPRNHCQVVRVYVNNKDNHFADIFTPFTSRNFFWWVLYGSLG